jgi:hypothetical protein
MILAEARLHKYTHTNYKLNVLNIKYYNFYSRFDTTEFYSRNGTRGYRSESLDDTRATPYPMVPPQKRSMHMQSPSTGPTVESGPLTRNRHRHH